jgi:hypothetical protein
MREPGPVATNGQRNEADKEKQSRGIAPDPRGADEAQRKPKQEETDDED